MIPLRKVRTLTLDVTRRQRRSPHISAASSLERHGNRLFVVADDELELGVFPLEPSQDGQVVRILEGRLSEDPGDRKREKPDLESLALVPPFGRRQHGALLALGSGSSDVRSRGALVPLQEDGWPAIDHQAVELGPLYHALKGELPDLNIEGAVAVGGVLRLLQRGDNEAGQNARIDLDLEAVSIALESGDPVPATAVRDVAHYDLGRLHGVSLCFSDGSALPDGRVVFAASAEDSRSSHGDGKTVGSAVGTLAPDGSIELIEPVDLDVKIEGLTARLQDDGIELLMVTDADDPSVPSPLLAARL
jgi:hypothetical protein